MKAKLTENRLPEKYFELITDQTQIVQLAHLE